MAVTPYTIFSVFPSGSDPLIRAWTRFREEIEAGARGQKRSAAVSFSVTAPSLDAPVAARVGESVIWRLLASNNREIGRSSFLYGSFASARAHAVQLQTRTEQMCVAVVQGPVGGTHGWYITSEGITVLTCSRWYGAAGAGREAAEAAIMVLSGAVIPDVPSRLNQTKSRDRSSRAYLHDGSQ